MWSAWLVFSDCGFHSVCPLMEKDKRLMEAFWWDRLTEGEIGSCSDGWAMLSKSLIQFSADGQGCVPSQLSDLKSNYGGGNRDNGDLLQKVPRRHWCTQWPQCWKSKSSKKKKIYFRFIDYAKVFDCVDHNKFWKILKEMGIPDHLTCLLRNLYTG